VSSIFPPEHERRSLLGKFRYAILFQALLIVVVAVVAFVPTLDALNDKADIRRRAASSEVIDSGVNSMARFVAMELGRDFLPTLWELADRATTAPSPQRRQEALDALRDAMGRVSQRVAEKMSYNSVLVDLIVVVPHRNPFDNGDTAIVLPTGHASLPVVSLSESIQFLRLKQLTRLDEQQKRSLAASGLGQYLLRRTAAPGLQAFIMPIRREDFPYGYAGMLINTELITEQFENQWRVFWRGLQESLLMLGILSMIALAGGAIFILVLASRLIRPLEAMRAAVENVRATSDGSINPQDLRVASTELAAVEADPADEVGALRNAFLEVSEGLADVLAQKADALQRLKESTRQLQRADRLKLVGTLTYGLAHNLNNALAPIANLAHAAAWRHPEDQKLNEMMSQVLAGLERSSDIVRRLRDLTRLSSGQTVAVGVNRVLEESLEIVRRSMSDAGIVVERQFGAVPDISGNPVELWEVFTNLLVNASEALARLPPDRPRRVIVRSFLHNGNVVVEIQDNGPGMSEEVRNKALEPWFSTKPEGDASGIGLWITRRLVEEHGGQLALQSEEGVGTTVRVTFIKMAETEIAAPAEHHQT
jgi:signal transduction histidine kinase